ncbi:MAG: 16S rRNA (cytidine(1402)-2'-O)-methyltransferase [Candidatus Uhrbacteria bacterium]|nr:16S rRNA (cytidine(1402)-2'-O)-methyltransferase [Candidatus Uhrbacteria bacterium]
MSGILSVVATPIGNLEDITLRALRVLREADAVACEDTRVGGHLLSLLNLPPKPLISIHQHSEDHSISSTIERIQNGERIAYISDAGTPNVNDPGGKLVEAAYAADCEIETIPGASAVTAAIAVCGFPMEHFRYLGFIPLKKHRASTLATIGTESDASIFFESTHRIEKTMNELAKTLQQDRIIYLGRELTKKFETHYRGTIREVLEKLAQGSLKGEFVCIVGPMTRIKDPSRRREA